MKKDELIQKIIIHPDMVDTSLVQTYMYIGLKTQKIKKLKEILNDLEEIDDK